MFQDVGPESPDLLESVGTEQRPSTDVFRDFHSASNAAAVADDIQALGASGVESLLAAEGTSAQFGVVQEGDADVMRRIKALEDACIESRIAALEAKHGIGDCSCVSAMAADACASAEPECERILEIEDSLDLVNEWKDPKRRKQPVAHLRRSVEEWEDEFKTQLEGERLARLRGQNTLQAVLGRQFANAIAILEQRLAFLESQLLPPGRLPARQIPLSEPESELLPSQSSFGHQGETPVQSRIHERTVPAATVGRRSTEELPQSSGDIGYPPQLPLSSLGLDRQRPPGWCGVAAEPHCSSRPLRSASSSAGGPTAGQPQSLGHPFPAPAKPRVPRIYGILSPRKLMSPRKQPAPASAAMAVGAFPAACDSSSSSDMGPQPRALRPQSRAETDHIRSWNI